MLIIPAYLPLQAGPFGGLEVLFPMLMMVVIFYFLLIRPQQQRAKEHQELISKVRRGDTVVTSGGFIGRVTKVPDNSDEIEVELNDQMKIRVLRSTLMDVRAKGEPVKDAS